MAFLDLSVPGHIVQDSVCHDEKKFFKQVKKFMSNFLVHSMDGFTKTFGNSTGTNALNDRTRTWNFTNTPLQKHPSSADAEEKAKIWKTHDLMTYIFTATPLAYVLPLCFKQIQQNLKKQASKDDCCQIKAILSCIPPANPDMQAHSELDWYFDYDLALQELVDLKINEIQSRMRRAATAPKSKNNRFSAEGLQPSLRAHFAVLLEAFHGKIQTLKRAVQQEVQKNPNLDKFCVWLQEDTFATTPQKPPSAWLGFGEVYGSFRRPVCIRNDPFEFGTPDYATFKEVMTSFSPSGYISAAIRSNVYSIKPKSETRRAAGGSSARNCAGDGSPLSLPDGFSQQERSQVS